MTLAEYSIVIQWQLDDRLQWQLPTGAWRDWLLENAPCQDFHFTAFRRKPECRPDHETWARIETGPSGASDAFEPQRITGTAAHHQAQV